jgi:hypothetical protein
VNRDHLLVVAERQALAWILKSRKMAFPPGRRRAAEALRKGDRLLIYTTRGCFHNPVRDRGRVIGEARVATAARRTQRPIKLAGREFSTVCDLELRSLAAPRTGVELAPLVPRLEAFPDADSWSVRMRTPIVSLPEADAALLRRLLKPLARDPKEVVADYVALGGPVNTRFKS